MELKHTYFARYEKDFLSFNRTSMELKHRFYSGEVVVQSALLIEPVWN